MAGTSPRPIVKMGTCAWTDKTLEGTFYRSKTVKTSDQKLAFYATQFPCVEVDTSNYSIPTPSRVGKWLAATPKGFLFHFKIFSLFAQQQIEDVNMLPGEVRAMLPQAILDKKTPVMWSELNEDIQESLWRIQNQSLGPAIEAQKLGIVLFQMPSRFFYSDENKQYLLYARSKLDPRAPMAVEFRDGSWLTPRHLDDTLAFMRQHQLILVSIDETIRVSAEYKKQMTQQAKPKPMTVGQEHPYILSAADVLAAEAAVKANEEEEKANLPPPSVVAAHTAAIANNDQPKKAMKYPITMYCTHDTTLYVRVHRREGTDRVLDDNEMAAWVQRMTEFVDSLPLHRGSVNQTPYTIYFMWNTNWEDQSMQNAKKFTKLINESTIKDKIELFDWISIVKDIQSRTGIAGMFNKQHAAEAALASQSSLPLTPSQPTPMPVATPLIVPSTIKADPLAGDSDDDIQDVTPPSLPSLPSSPKANPKKRSASSASPANSPSKKGKKDDKPQGNIASFFKKS